MFFWRLIDVKAIRKSNIKTDVELFMKKNRLNFPHNSSFESKIRTKIINKTYSC
jgi:hypothetical protein